MAIISSDNLDANHKYGAYFASTDDQYDIQRAYHFVLQFTGTNSGGGNIENVNNKDLDVFSLAVQSCRIPDLNNNMIEFAHGATKIKISGQHEFTDFDVQIVDFIGHDIERLLVEWYDTVCQLTVSGGNRFEVGRQNYLSKYKRKAILLELPPDGNEDKGRQWELYGIFPTSFQPGSFDYTSNGVKQVSMTFSVDYAKRMK